MGAADRLEAVIGPLVERGLVCMTCCGASRYDGWALGFETERRARGDCPGRCTFGYFPPSHDQAMLLTNALVKALTGLLAAAEPEPVLSDPSAPSTMTGSAHPETSYSAAQTAFPNSGTQRHRVLSLIARMREHGATDDEVGDALALDGNSVRPRRLELEAGGWIRDSGERRPSRHNNEAIVWVLTEAARTKLEE